MDYIFGKRFYDGKETEFVKIVSDDDYANIRDGSFVEHFYETSSVKIKHTFRVLWNFKKDLDLTGKFQSWYYIDSHIIEIDNGPAIQALADEFEAKINKLKKELKSLKESK